MINELKKTSILMYILYSCTFFTHVYILFKKGFDGPKIQPGVGPLKPGVDSQQEAVYHGFYQVKGISLIFTIQIIRVK